MRERTGLDWRAFIALSVCRLLYGNDGDVYFASGKLNAWSAPSRLLIYSTNREAWKLGEALQTMVDREALINVEGKPSSTVGRSDHEA